MDVEVDLSVLNAIWHLFSIVHFSSYLLFVPTKLLLLLCNTNHVNYDMLFLLNPKTYFEHLKVLSVT